MKFARMEGVFLYTSAEYFFARFECLIMVDFYELSGDVSYCLER